MILKTSPIPIFITLVLLMAIAPGCSHEATTPASDSSAAYSLLPQTQAEDQFIKDVGNLPADQRKSYILAHRDALSQLMSDPDKSKMAQLNNLLPPEIP